MGSASSKFRKHLQAGDEVQALQLYGTNSELRKALDPNCSYGDSHQHETPLHLAAKHGMQNLLALLLFSKGGNPRKTNARKETCLHSVCMELNSRSVHVDKRRAECLNHLLKWRGATLAEGQVEKVDLSAQDEKLNTALHYAAASGLSQCVEILIQHGAPLFIENEDNMTPCDTAEKNGHARIALYLESKMVFSNDGEPQGEEDNVSMPPVEEYSGLRPQDLQEAKDHLLVETADMLSVPLFTAEALLRNHEWSREMLLEAWMTDPIACCEKCGVTPPSTLFSEKPQVQENLASPLPSPMHATPSPQYAECNICANAFPIADEPVHMACAHRFCKECWERYLNVKIQEGDAHHITCPAYDCTMLVPMDIIEGIVSRDMALRYLQFDIKAFVDSNPDMKWCPYPGCGRAVKLPDLDLTLNQGLKPNKIPSDTSRGVDCGAGHYFCWECLEESHEPCSCENWNRWFQKISEVKPETLNGTEQETELAANCLWLVTNSKPCPNCKSPIQKNEGCNHMKCSKCKFDFCWVCLEQWKRHNSSTGGYFKCNRYEVVKKVEEQSAQLVSEAESKNKNMQELNRFVHYYTRFKNHENSYKLEEPLLKTVKDKMMKLAEAVTDIATAHAETKFVEDAVQQLLKARRVLKCSYVYGFYLDGPGYKKIVFEFMQTELEECTEILSQMVNRLYLRTPRRRIMEQAHIIQRKRLEFITAISKGLVPPETPPNARKGKMKRKISGGAVDEDLHRAIVASIQEVDPANPWIKDASGRHTNVVALLEWPSDDSDQSEGEPELRTRENIGKCHRSGCNKVRAKNPRTNEHHDYCSRWCMQVDKEDQNKKEVEGMSEIILDEHMELLRALEMSRLQYLRDNGLLHVPDSQDSQSSSRPHQTKATKTRGQNYRHRPRSNSAGQEAKGKNKVLGLNSMEELGIELQRFQELSSAFAMGERGEASGDRNRPLTKSESHHCHKLSQSSRFDESGSTVVTRVPNRSVEDLYRCDQTPKSSKPSHCQNQALFGEAPESFSAGLLDSPGSMAAYSDDALSDGRGPGGRMTDTSPSELSEATSNDEPLVSPTFVGTMFGAIKDISVSNIHSDESDKTRDFQSKDLASIFAAWDSDESGRKTTSSSHGGHVTLDAGCTKRSFGSQVAGKPLTERCAVRADEQEMEGCSSRASVTERVKSLTPYTTSSSSKGGSSRLEGESWSLQYGSHPAGHPESDGNQSSERLLTPDQLTVDFPLETSREREDFRRISLLEMAENLLQMTTDIHSRMKEIERGKHSIDAGTCAVAGKTRRSEATGSPKSVVQAACGSNFEKRPRRSDDVLLSDRADTDQWLESVTDSGGSRDPATGKENRIHLPRTAWSAEEDMSAGWSSVGPKTNKRASLSPKTKVFDSDEACRKSPHKRSLKPKNSNGKAVSIALLCDSDNNVHEVPLRSRKQAGSHIQASKVNINTTSPAASSSTAFTEKLNEASMSASGDRPLTVLSSSSLIDMRRAENCHDSDTAHQDSITSSTKPTNDAHTSASLKPNSLTGTAVMSSAGVAAAEVAKDSDVSKTALVKDVSDEKLSSYSSYAAEDEDYFSTTGTEAAEENIAISALITDAYETAASDDVWEDASPELPSDNQQFQKKDQDDEEDDDSDLVYI